MELSPVFTKAKSKKGDSIILATVSFFLILCQLYVSVPSSCLFLCLNWSSYSILQHPSNSWSPGSWEKNAFELSCGVTSLALCWFNSLISMFAPGRGPGLSLLCVLAPGSPFRNMGGPAAHLGEARPGCREPIQVLEQVFPGRALWRLVVTGLTCWGGRWSWGPVPPVGSGGLFE